MTIGDVLAVVAGIGSACVAAWTLLVASALLFPGIARHGQLALEQRPWRTVITGFVILALSIGGSLILMNLPNGFVKLLGWVLLLAMLSLGALGSGSVAKLLGQRVKNADPKLSNFGALLRGAAIPIVGALLPLLGWFVVLPLGFSASLGAGWAALRIRKHHLMHKQRAPQAHFVMNTPQPAEAPLSSTQVAPQI